EYFNSRATGKVALSWQSASQPRQKVPSTVLSAEIPGPLAGGWTLNGSAALVDGSLVLTPATPSAVGSAFWPKAMPSVALDASFDLSIDGGNGADGLTLTLADASSTAPTALGAAGGGLGFSGIQGIAIAFDTFQNGVNPSDNFVGIADGPGAT